MVAGAMPLWPLVQMWLLFLLTASADYDFNVTQLESRTCHADPSCQQHSAAAISDSYESFVSYADWSEDLYTFETFFRHRLRGTFLEIGALDGVAHSITKFFEDYRGWSGVLVEANPALSRLLCRNRACSTKINAVACDRPGQLLHYVLPYSKMHKCGMELAGIREYFSQSRRKWLRNLPHPSRVFPVRCFSLTQMVRSANVTHLDFFSLDVEGAELAVLNTFDFSQITVDVLMVELDRSNHAKDDRVRALLASLGFAVHSRRGLNFWFVRKDSPYYRGNDSQATYTLSPAAAKVRRYPSNKSPIYQWCNYR